MPSHQSNDLPGPSYAKLFHQREYSFRKEFNRRHLEKLAEEHCLTSIFEHVRCKIPDDSRSTFLTAFSPNGKMVASTHGDHKIYVCDVATGNLLHTLEGHPRTPWCIAFHPSCNDILASGCLGGEVRVWDLHGGSEMWATQPSTVITSLTFHPLDKVLVVATHNMLYFWDWTQPQPFASCATASKRERVRYVKFNKLGNKLITGIANLPCEGMSRVMDNILGYNMPRRPPPLEPLYDSNGEIRHPPQTLFEELNAERQMPPPPRSTDSPDEAIRHAREYAEAVTLSSHRFPTITSRFASTSSLADRLVIHTVMEEELSPIFRSGLRNTELETTLMEWEESLENIGGFDRDFWRTFRRLQMLCRQMELQVQQSAANDGPASRLALSMSMIHIQQELETSVVSLLTRLQMTLRSMELDSIFARDQINTIRGRINTILLRLRSRTQPQRPFEDPSEPSTSQDPAYRQWCTVCTPPVEHDLREAWNPRYCLWLLESSLNLTRQMQGILVADQRLSWLENGLDNVTNSGGSGQSAAQDLTSPESPHPELPGLRLRMRRFRNSLLQRESPYYPRNPSSITPFNSSNAPLMLRRNLRLQLNSAASSAQVEVDHPPQPAEPSSAHMHSSSEEDPSYPPRRSHHRRPYSMLDRLNNVLSRIRSHWVDNSDSSSDEGTPASDHRAIHPQLQQRVDRLREMLNNSSSNLPPPPPEEPPPPPQASASYDRSLGSLYNAYISYFFENSIRSRLGSMFGLSDSPTNLTHRIQCWDFSNYTIPNISNEKVNVAMGRCKIHNDGSVAVCEEGHKLMALVPSRSLILVLTVVSLEPRTLGQVLHTCRFGPNVISLSFSPLGHHMLVGLAASNRFYLDLQGGTRTNRHTVAQIFRLDPGTVSPVRVRSITLMSLLGTETESNNSHFQPGVNTVRWLPQPGQGLVAGTNRGSVTICRPLRPISHPDGPGNDLGPRPASQRLTQTTGTQTFGSSISIIHRRPPVSPMHRSGSHHASAATQTTHPRTHTTGTQTWVGDRPLH